MPKPMRRLRTALMACALAFPAAVQADEEGIDGERSDIEITPWNRNEIKAVVELTAKHPDRHTAEKDLETLHYTADNSGRTVSLHNFVVLTKNGAKPQSNLKARFTLFVPANCAVEIQNSFGKTTVKGLQTVMQLQTEFCTVELTDLRGNITARTVGLRFGADWTSGRKQSG